MCAITENPSATTSEAALPPPPQAPQAKALHPPALRHPRPATTSDAHLPDVLAKVTYAQKLAVDWLYDSFARFSATNIGKVLTRTTQPVHVLAVVAVTLAAAGFLPNRQARPSSIANFIYYGTLSIHVGAQFWMTFISGLALYFSLPRHMFGEVQKVLFPKYFTLNTFLGAVGLYMFARMHGRTEWDNHHIMQVVPMGICFLIDLYTRVCVVPHVVRLIDAKTAIEKTVPGVGEEIGKHNPRSLIHCPHYMRLHSQFRKKHMVVAMANITSMVCTSLQVFFIQYGMLACTQ